MGVICADDRVLLVLFFVCPLLSIRRVHTPSAIIGRIAAVAHAPTSLCLLVRSTSIIDIISFQAVPHRTVATVSFTLLRHVKPDALLRPASIIIRALPHNLPPRLRRINPDTLLRSAVGLTKTSPACRRIVLSLLLPLLCLLDDTRHFVFWKWRWIREHVVCREVVIVEVD